METYIYITTADKKKLLDLANKHRLSLSTTCRIIIDHYYWLSRTDQYTYKGEKQVHIKIRNNVGNGLNAMTATNAIGNYLHRDLLPKNVNVKKINTKIANEMANTEDPNANKNIEIRIAWRIKKGAY